MTKADKIAAAMRPSGSARAYSELGIKLLMVAVLEEAIADYRTLTPRPQREYRLGAARCGRPRKCKWTTARDLLDGKSPGPGGMTMLEFFFTWLNVDEGVINRGVLIGKDGVYDVAELRRRYSSVARNTGREVACAHRKLRR